MVVLGQLSFGGTSRLRNRSFKQVSFLLPLLLSGCFSFGSPSNNPNAQWLPSGSLALSRPVPAPNLFNASSTLTPPLAGQVMSDTTAASLVISRKDKTVTALKPGQTPLVIKTEGTELLKPGSYAVTAKEQNPLWYAPESYFINRSLTVPAEGSRERFKRAALGSKTLYLNDQTPIHSGPIWMKEIGGVRLNQQQMSQIFSSIEIGTRVEVR